jgi:hypothetical protein
MVVILEGGPMANKTCFVVMGFGTKTDYTKPKTFNLDKTYRNIIKPAAQAAGLDCVRADEIQHSGNINVPMYEQLLNADVVVADVSTYNCNAFYELGVRHALRPHTTIVITEDGLTFPFDVAQIAVRKYHHLGEGIDSEEVDRMKTELAKAMRIISEMQQADSPVYTFVKDLKPPMLIKAEEIAAEAATLPLTGAAAAEPASNNPTISILVEQAEDALSKNNFCLAKALYADLSARMPQEVSFVQKLALTTYKSKLPTEKDALDEACRLLWKLNSAGSTDTETLGLLQAVHKGLWNLTRDLHHLDKAIWSSEKGFYLKNDYYNGINLAFLYNVRASLSNGAEAITDFVLAQRTRRHVIEVCENIVTQMKGAGTAKRFDRDARYWVLATLAEAWTGLGDEAKGQAYTEEALALTPPTPQWMIDNPREQLDKLRSLLANPPVGA